MLRPARGWGLVALLLASLPLHPSSYAQSLVGGPLPACSPPALVDLSLERVDPPSQPAWAGSTGTLSLKATWRGGSTGPRQFAILHDLDPLPYGDEQTLRLESLDTSPCLFLEFVGPGPFPGLFGLYYHAQGELQPAPHSTATCLLQYHVLPGALVPDQIRFRVLPLGCAADPNSSDNFLEFAFGGPAPAVPVPGPGRGGLLLAVAAMLLAAVVEVGARRRGPRQVATNARRRASQSV